MFDLVGVHCFGYGGGVVGVDYGVGGVLGVVECLMDYFGDFSVDVGSFFGGGWFVELLQGCMAETVSPILLVIVVVRGGGSGGGNGLLILCWFGVFPRRPMIYRDATPITLF